MCWKDMILIFILVRKLVKCSEWKKLFFLHKYSTLRELADMHLPVMSSWTQGEFKKKV